MNKAFIITSSIDVDNSSPLTYSPVRSFFSTEERLRQTIFTISSLDQATDSSTHFYILDTSDNDYSHNFQYQKNLKFISIKYHFPEIFEEVRKHPNKSRCESLMLSKFLARFKKQLEQYDFIFKVSGRYFLDRSFDINLINNSSLDRVFFKKPLEFKWDNAWNYSMVDLRNVSGDDNLRQYSSVIFGWGKEQQSKFIDIFDTLATVLGQPNTMHYDIETLIYYFTRCFENNIIETDWMVYGWVGVDGTFMRY